LERSLEEFVQTQTGWAVEVARRTVGLIEVREFSTVAELEAQAAQVDAVSESISIRVNTSTTTMAATGFAEDMRRLVAGPLSTGTPIVVSADAARSLWRDVALRLGRLLFAQGQLPAARESPEFIARRVTGNAGPPGVPVFFVAFAYEDDATSREVLDRVGALLDDGDGGYVSRLGYGAEGAGAPTVWLVVAVTHDQFQKDRLFMFEWGDSGESSAAALTDDVLAQVVERAFGPALTLVPF